MRWRGCDAARFARVLGCRLTAPLRGALSQRVCFVSSKDREIYYAAEKLAEEPEHAHLIPYVEQMRTIYRRDFGTPIPERE